MSIESVRLDDLTWADLTQGARDRIAGASGGDWTLHAPVDPGVTLLELFASQLDQRLYMLDQPSDELQHVLLKFLGFRPRPVGCARTVASLQSQRLDCFPVPRRTELHSSRMDDPLTFRTTRAVHVLPFAWNQTRSQRRQVRTPPRTEMDWLGTPGTAEHEVSLTSELAGGHAPPLFRPGVATATTVLRFRVSSEIQVPEACEAATLGFLVELATPASVMPSWHPATGSEVGWMPRAAPVRWHASLHVDGSVQHLAIRKRRDGTRGLRRSGVVELSGTWCRPVSDSPRKSADPYLELVLSADPRRFVFIPRLTRIVPNAVVAEHRSNLPLNLEKLNECVRKWGRLPRNVLDLSQSSDELLIPDETLRVCLREPASGGEPGGWFSWNFVSSFAHRGPTSRVFQADRKGGRLLFGDGLEGRVPRVAQDAMPVIQVRAERGGGPRGNVAGGHLWRADDGLCEAVNVVPAVDGREAETLEQASRRCRLELQDPTRAVTVADIERLARATPGAGIARAHAAVGRDPAAPRFPTPGVMTVCIVPDLPPRLRDAIDEDAGEDLVALRPDEETLQAVSRWLADKRLLTHAIRVSGPTYEELDLQVRIADQPPEREVVRAEIRRALIAYLHPLYGGSDGSGWPFGAAVIPSELMRAAQRSIDSEIRVQQVAIRKRSKPEPAPRPGDRCCDVEQRSAEDDFERCKEVALAPRSLVAVRTVDVQFVRSTSFAGGLL